MSNPIRIHRCAQHTTRKLLSNCAITTIQIVLIAFDNPLQAQLLQFFFRREKSHRLKVIGAKVATNLLRWIACEAALLDDRMPNIALNILWTRLFSATMMRSRMRKWCWHVAYLIFHHIRDASTANIWNDRWNMRFHHFFATVSTRKCSENLHVYMH